MLLSKSLLRQFAAFLSVISKKYLSVLVLIIWMSSGLLLHFTPCSSISINSWLSLFHCHIRAVLVVEFLISQFDGFPYLNNHHVKWRLSSDFLVYKLWCWWATIFPSHSQAITVMAFCHSHCCDTVYSDMSLSTSSSHMDGHEGPIRKHHFRLRLMVWLSDA